MADFDPPFGQDGERRLPTTTEREHGFVCGPADRELFTGLFHRIESEIGEVIQHAGIAPTDERNTLLREAIEALIAAATGGGSVDDYLLMSQASSRLPIYPDVLTNDGRISVTSPATGQVRIPGGVTFHHRGIARFTTAQADFGTDASKTYHLRWNPNDGFALKDLASGAYNPTSASETNAAFDSSFDDMLVARIITNSSNVPTITALANKSALAIAEIIAGTDGVLVGRQGANFRFQKSLNWSRTPRSVSLSLAKMIWADGTGDLDRNVFAYGLPRTPNSAVNANPPSIPTTRYGLDAVVEHDGADELHMQFSAGA